MASKHWRPSALRHTAPAASGLSPTSSSARDERVMVYLNDSSSAEMLKTSGRIDNVRVLVEESGVFRAERIPSQVISILAGGVRCASGRANPRGSLEQGHGNGTSNHSYPRRHGL
jgi:hypothetical protein